MATKKSTRKISLDASGPLTKFFADMDDKTSMELERLLGSNGISARLNGVNMLILKCPSDDSKRVSENLEKLNNSSAKITLELIQKTIEAPQELSEEEVSENWGSITLRHAKTGFFSTIKPKTQHQQDAINAMLDKKVALLMGSAGTGKSFLALAFALKLLETKKIHKIIVSKPPIESGPSIGFLPGDMDDKLESYVLSIMSILTELIGVERRDKLMKDGSIQVENIGFLRGMTIGARQGVIAIIDEVQNIEFSQHKLLLSRLGDHPESRMILCGDQKQSDLRHKKDTLSLIHSIIKDSPFVGSVIFDRSDIVRSPVVKDLMERIEGYEDNEAEIKSKKVGY